MYKLFTDKLENFEAKIKIEGASLKKSKARLVVEAENFSLLFNGKIDESGNVKIPVRRLRGLMDEDTSGAIRLEVIAEDTFFTPWESEFTVKTSKTVQAEVVSQSGETITENQTTSTVIIKSQTESDIPTVSEKQHIVNIMKILIKENINISNLHVKKDKLNNIVAEYISDNTVTEEQRQPVISKLLKVLDKRK